MRRLATLLLLLTLPVISSAALQKRQIGGVDLWYDPVLDVTWHGNANLALTEQFGLPLAATGVPAGFGEITTVGTMSWDTAQLWIAAMNEANYLGYNDWRLPRVAPANGGTFFQYESSLDGSTDRGYNLSAPGTLYAGSTASEMAYLYYNTLGNLAFFEEGGGLVNSGPFLNLIAGGYWTGTNYGFGDFAPDLRWVFRFGTLNGFAAGNQGGNTRGFNLHAWPVRSGNVVPLPAATWLFLSALGVVAGLRSFARRPALTG
jgi:hypothetical protein